MQTLEKSLSQVVRDFEREREAIEAKHKEQVRTLPHRGLVTPLPPRAVLALDDGPPPVTDGGPCAGG